MITTYANKTLFGKRAGYTAELGEFHAEGKTAADAKRALVETIARYSPVRYVLGTASGDVVIVTRSVTGCMEYSICGAGRSYGSGCLMNTTHAKEAVEKAREHATQAFGGVVWEQAF